MADCSYVRCVQERRFIKRELQKWTKSMVYIVGLERVAEELMGRRKWKLYQEVLARSHINTNSTSLAQNNTSTELLNHNNGEQQQNISQIEKNSSQQQNLENHSKENEVATVKCEAQEPDSGLTEISENQELFADTTIVKVEPNNSDINSRESKNITITDEDTEIGPQKQPVDWRPQDKCYFCVDGKLLAVNERGELVAEPGPVNTEPDLAHTTPLDSDSESSESCSEAEVQNSAAAVAAAASKSVAAFFRGSLPPNMTSFESIAVQLAAVASLQGLPTPFYPGLWYQQLAQQMPHATDSPVAAAANVATTIPTVKPSPSPNESIVNSEQPLDLSAKSSSSSGTTAMEPKHIFKAKPRMSALSGRRTYTEDELQNALQDILSGKLGTRRAAVLYGIPRSTLRNKVYKLAMEQKREANLHPLPTPGLADLDDEDKDLSGGEDEKEVEKTLNAMQLPQEELLRLSSTQSLAAAAMQKYSKLYDSSSLNAKQDLPVEQPKPPQTPTTPQTPTLPPNPWLDPNMLLQSLLLSGGLGALPGLLQPKSDEAAALPEFLRNLMLQQQELIKKQMESSVQVNEHMNNGKPSPDPRILMQNLPLVQQQQQQQQQQHHHQQHTQNNQQPYMNRVCKSETPETASSVDLSDINDDSAVILKIPSFKPVAGSSSTSVGKNGDSTPQSLTTTPLHSRSPQQSHLSGISPPLMRQSSESQSPPISGKGTLSLRDVIAKSISKTFQQMPGSEPDQYKKPSISVIKSIGDIRFGNSPNMLGNNSNNQSSSSTGTGGKGTRPKRGKYRNYDRDSLVEAVKAVQRGEMSVHRAGSYYGVPHSTLEYKVKERHLMRPRKREPKPQPLDERVGSSSSSVTNPKPSDIPSSATMRNALDKSKILSTTKPPMKTPPFPANSPNGLKMPFMDSAMQAQLQYAPHLFWPHPPGFGGLPMDFTRSPGATPTFPPNAADNFFASQMIQRFQEDSARHQQNSSSSTATSSTAVSLKTSSSATNNTSTPKTAREMAESLYDGTNANGSFLDGIIRHSLDRKPAEVAQGVLLEQLVKNSLPNSMTHNDSSTAIKRSGSPIPFIHEIKKERTSPPLMSSGHDSDRDPVDLAKESVEHLIKLRDGLTLRRGSTEDHNGSTTSNEDKMKLMSSDNEDSS